MKIERSSRASALIIVLAFIVLISIVLLSYMASTQSALKKSSSSAAIVETDILADTAIASVVDDLRQEMVAGAAAAPNSTNPFMAVTNAWAMVPARVISSNVPPADMNFANLVKQSLNTSFYPGSSAAAIYTAKEGADTRGRARATSISTAQPSLNGRMVSAARWNKPRLLRGAGFSQNNQLPNWILITRGGPSTDGTTPDGYNDKNSANYVIGRFSYNIYDVGGLLDINIAGFPQISTNEAINKGSLAWADLTAIPGITSVSAAERFVSWRNKLSNTSTNYVNMVRAWGLPRGFREPFNNGADQENRFFNRQDLIKYVESAYASNSITTNALPYLTTFSADMEQPTFAPDSRRPKVLRNSAGGGNDAYGQDDAVNPSFLSLVVDKDLRVKRRFPLDRLKYVLPETPSGSTAGQLIEKYFGLTWDSASYAWRYSVDGSSTQIKRLSQIDAEREPNFVELLKAAITVGSLGGQYKLDDESASSPRKLNGRDGSTNYHIMQIVASIIDQYDTDSYPTRILFDGLTFYGVEDIPYIYGLRAIGYRQDEVQVSQITATKKVPEKNGVPAATKSGRNVPYRYVMMLQPLIWNPHKASSAEFSGPKQFRFAIRGPGDVRVDTGQSASGLDYWTTPNTWIRNFLGTDDRDTKNAVVNYTFDNSYMDFFSRTVAEPQVDIFRNPFTLKSPDYPPGSQLAANGRPNGSVEETSISNTEQNDPSKSNELTRRIIGFRLGWMWGGPADSDSNSDGFLWRARTYSDLDGRLQYLAPNGQYVTYDEMPSIPPIETIYIDAMPNLDPKNRRPRLWARVDPRADRFGPRSFLVRVQRETNYDQYFAQGETFRPGPTNAGGDNFGVGRLGFADSATSAQTGWVRGVRPEAWLTAADNTTTSSSANAVYYADPDGVVRKAMGGQASGLAGLPMATANYESRPIILNRPFRSVAELGYAFRGMPWKQLDFWTPESGDAALLDVFCISELQDESGQPLPQTVDPIVAGRVNLNSRNPEVLQAVLQGAAKADGVSLTSVEAKNVADALTAWTTNTVAGKGPLRNRSELVGKYDPAAASKFSGFSSEIKSRLAGTDGSIQMRHQSVMRALVDSGTTRTWSFLIDLVVQKGKYPVSSTSLDKFVVEGEQRYWVHLALDRITGKILFENVEEVNE